MAITITFYVNKSLPNMVSKTLTGAVAVQGELLDPLEEENPRIRFKANSNVESCNYFVIGNNKYFMGPIEKKNDSVWYVTGYLDKLSTYETFVRNLTGYIGRSQSEKPYIKDPEDTLLAYKTQESIAFSGGWSGSASDGLYLIITAQDGYDNVSS